MDMDHGTLVRPDPLDTSDVDGARPKPLPIRLRSNHPFNTNADIEYSSPHFQQTHGKFYTQRNSNTLQPSYKLPSSSFDPLPPPRSKPRDLLWTLPQNDWKPQTRDIMNWSDVEGHGRDFLFRKAAGKRDTIDARDINRPQFRCEEPSQRRTDPLRPTYVYDNGEVDHVVTHVPKYGQRYGRTPEENYNLIVKDVNGDNVHQSCYPNWLIKTRKANNTQDIPGAQADTMWVGPAVWRLPGKNMDACIEKETNRVWDIDGAVAGTGGAGIKMYRNMKQLEATEKYQAATAKMRTALIASDITKGADERRAAAAEPLTATMPLSRSGSQAGTQAIPPLGLSRGGSGQGSGAITPHRVHGTATPPVAYAFAVATPANPNTYARVSQRERQSDIDSVRSLQ